MGSRHEESHHGYLVDKTSPGTLSKFKELYAKEFPEPVRAKVEKASSGKEIVEVIKGLGPPFEKRVTFAVQQAYKGVLSDVKHIDVWTELTDCGVRFVNGETYVVYAGPGKHGLVTRVCSRTRRLSEAREDLTYFHFMQIGGEEVGRI